MVISLPTKKLNNPVASPRARVCYNAPVALLPVAVVGLADAKDVLQPDLPTKLTRSTFVQLNTRKRIQSLTMTPRECTSISSLGLRL